MADDITTFMSESEISSIKETLHAQQQLLQKLYNELDAEREASASAANEALSVILRLQGEKATIKMEAEQYKRLSEDKINQMEDSLAIMQELIYHKEMEVTALDYQVQAYRCKLLDMGCVDHNATLIHDACFRRHEEFVEDDRRDSNIGLKEEKGSSLNQELCNKASDFDNCASEGVVGSYWDTIKELDNRVRDIVGVNCSRSSLPQLDVSSTSTSDIQGSVINHSENLMNDVNVDQNACSKSVHDVFEVPQVEKSRVIVSHKPLEEYGKKTDRENDGYRSRSTYYEESICGIANVPLLQPRLDHRHVASEIERIDESEFSNREEQLILLNEIKEKVCSLHDEVRRWKAMKSPIKDEPLLSTLQEAMLYFWL